MFKFALDVLALQVQKYKILTRMRALAALMRHRQRHFTCFTCFTGTKLQILTRMRALAALMRHSSGSVVKQGSLLLIGARFTCFTGTNVLVQTCFTGTKAASPEGGRAAGDRCSIYLLYWYKTTNTDANCCFW